MFYFTTSFNKYSNNDRYRNDRNAVHSAVIVMGGHMGDWLPEHAESEWLFREGWQALQAVGIIYFSKCIYLEHLHLW